MPCIPRPRPTWSPEWASGSGPVGSGNTPPGAAPRHRPPGGPGRFSPCPAAGRRAPSGTHRPQIFSARRSAWCPASGPGGSAPSLVADQGQRGLHRAGGQLVLFLCLTHVHKTSPKAVPVSGGTSRKSRALSRFLSGTGRDGKPCPGVFCGLFIFPRRSGRKWSGSGRPGCVFRSAPPEPPGRPRHR